MSDNQVRVVLISACAVVFVLQAVDYWLAHDVIDRPRRVMWIGNAAIIAGTGIASVGVIVGAPLAVRIGVILFGLVMQGFGFAADIRSRRGHQ